MKHSPECRICGSLGDHRIWIAREMMYGLHDEFPYFECASCGCLQIAEIPENLDKYYPDDYYSFTKPEKPRNLKEKLIESQIARYHLNGVNLLGWVFERRYRISSRYPLWIKGNKLGVKKTDRILDIGCGAGELIFRWRELYGFSQLLGADPYIPEDIEYENGVRILKRELEDIDGRFDVIMMHHSFEHVKNPGHVMKQIARLLNPKGRVLIRTPVADSYAWKKYGVNWVQLDAPRHLFIPTVRSMNILAEAASLRLTDVVYDSTEFQFWASEQYRVGIPLTGKNAIASFSPVGTFTPQQIRTFSEKAEELNRKKEGDQCCFYLEAKP